MLLLLLSGSIIEASLAPERQRESHAILGFGNLSTELS
jgi:hypothetical protein